VAATVQEKSWIGWFKLCVGTGIHFWLQLWNRLRS